MKITREVDIFQCPPSIKYCFMPLDMVKAEDIKITDYVRVWHGEIELDGVPDGAPEENIQKAICEKCFCHFQDGQDKTFFGRSLSTSDIIRVRKDNTFHYYYCDFVGWKWIKTQGIGTQGIGK